VLAILPLKLPARRRKTMNAVNWFEIPVLDMDRAARFYGAIFETELEVDEIYPGFKMALLPYERGKGVGGAIVQGEGYIPGGESGVKVYLNGGDDLALVMNRVAGAGGSVAVEKTNIGENGFMGFFTDTEGNTVGLHSDN
jgi:predicted enzyme related to lactoylglutathione lyase